MKEPIAKRLYQWIDARAHISPAVEYMKNKEVPQHRHSVWYYFGGFALFLLALQIVSGVLLMLRYEPSATPAADPISGKPLCMARAIDSVVVIKVTDSTLFDYSLDDEVAFTYSGAPESGLPDELRGKSKIEYVIPKDSVMIVPYTVSADIVKDTSQKDSTVMAGTQDAGEPTATLHQTPDVAKVILDHILIVRDPSTGDIIYPSVAYVSVQNIMTNVPFGSFMRSIHAYGANLLVACVLLHMFSVFLMKGYRKPHEMLWMTGVLLLVIVFGFGFTGYLLPWTKLSYFATRVGVGYPESFIPGIGKFIAGIMRGGAEVSGETLTRMFALHVVVLPLSVLLFVTIHIALLQVHGTGNPAGVKQTGMNVIAAVVGAVSLGTIAVYRSTTTNFDFTSPWFIIPITILPVVVGSFLGQVLLGREKSSEGQLLPVRFYWNFAMRDYIVWLIGLALLVALATFSPWRIEGDSGFPIDTTKPLVTPIGIHPEWYFMFAFEFLRLVPGEIAMILIAAGGAVWFVIPFLDKNSQHGRKSSRFTWIGIAIIAGFLSLTWLSYRAVDDEFRQAAATSHMK